MLTCWYSSIHFSSRKIKLFVNQERYKIVKEEITKHKVQWARLRDYLIEYKTLTGEECRTIFNGGRPSRLSSEGLPSSWQCFLAFHVSSWKCFLVFELYSVKWLSEEMTPQRNEDDANEIMHTFMMTMFVGLVVGNGNLLFYSLLIKLWCVAIFGPARPSF